MLTFDAPAVHSIVSGMTLVESSPAKPLQVGEWTVEPSLNRLRRGDRVETVEPRVMEVLLTLARRPGALVTREELFGEVWGGRFTTDHSLTQAIFELRRILGDDSSTPHVIETIRGKGYRLLAAAGTVDRLVEPAASPAAAAGRRGRWWGAAAAVLLLAAGFLVSQRSPVPQETQWRVVPLTATHEEERDPSLSPDGSRVAYARSDGASFDLFLRSVGGGGPLQLTRGPADDREPAWSPDGARLAFLRFEEGAGSIWVIDALGGEPRRIAAYAPPEEAGLAWSPSGGELAVPCHGLAGGWAICRLSLDDLELRPVTDAGGGEFHDHSPAYSPDGEWISFQRSRAAGVEDLWIARPQGGSERRLTYDDLDITGHAWWRGNAYLVFSSSRAGVYSLWRVLAAGGQPEWIAGGGSKIKDPTAARTADTLAYEAWEIEINLWRAPIDPPAGGDPAVEPFVVSSAWDYLPAVAPNGSALAFVSNRTGSQEIWLADGAGGEPRQLTAFGGPAAADPAWSPDGQRLVFVARPEGQADLYLLEVGEAVPHRLTRHSTDEVAPIWSRDGRRIYFASRRSGRWEIWAIGVVGGEAERITTEGGYMARESPAGELYFTRAGEAGIFRLTASGAGERVTGDLAPEDWRHWAAGVQALYYLDRPEPGRAELTRLPYGGGAGVPVATLDPSTWGLAVDPGARWVYFTRIDRSSTDLVALVPASGRSLGASGSSDEQRIEGEGIRPAPARR